MNTRSEMAGFHLQEAPKIHVDLSIGDLVNEIGQRKEGFVTQGGIVVVHTGIFTGRSPRDKYIMSNLPQEKGIKWGSINQPISRESFYQIYELLIKHLQKKDLFLQHLLVGVEDSLNLPVRVITETAWHSLFARNLFKIFPPGKTFPTRDVYTILHSPSIKINSKIIGLNSRVFVVLDLMNRLILIGGTSYAGEIKKSVFTALNYEFPRRGILTMHCAANVGINRDVGLFFGLSGTGKTTLSTSPNRELIGDDEHAWSENGIFNLEGGCYAKTIHLDGKKEPIIWKAVHRKGSVLENVPYDPKTGTLDFESDRLTENTRAAYPLSFVSRQKEISIYNHPKNIFFLTADAFGVLPPLSRLTPEQAIFHFLSGYTSKISGTERGLGREPCATFSACFSEPFLPLAPQKYAELLRDKLRQFGSKVWLVNTGWIGGPYGKGHRISLEYTRSLIEAVLLGTIKEGSFIREPFFDLMIPQHIPDVPDEILNPRTTWEYPGDYDLRAAGLKKAFIKNNAKYGEKI
jgi:phosphoenolpyruvate carboxykinase (ATP)